jgi:hypothetical protein
MNLLQGGKLVAVAFASVVALSAVGAIAAETFGRAGGAVDAQCIQRLSDLKPMPGAQAADLPNWYGRAGGPVGVQRVVDVNTKPKTYAAGPTKTPTVFGRTGIALPVGG